HDRPVDKGQVVVMELREPAKIGKETPSLHRQIIGQRGGNHGRLFHFHAIWRPTDDRVTASKRIDRGRQTEFGSTEVKIVALVFPIGKRRIDNETDRRIKLGWEGLTRRREFGLDVAQDLLPHLLLELFSVAGSRWCRWRGRHRGRCGGGTELL